MLEDNLLICDYCQENKSISKFSNKYRQRKYLDVKRQEMRLCKTCSSRLYRHNLSLSKGKKDKKENY